MSDSQAYVNVSNISNEAGQQEIKEYLSLVGPIKKCDFNKNGCKLSAKVWYYDLQTTNMAVNFLGETDFRGRQLKINLIDSDRNKIQRLSADDQIYDDLIKLSPEQRVKVAALATKFFKAQGNDFAQFLAGHNKIQEGLSAIMTPKRAPQNNMYNSYH